MRALRTFIVASAIASVSYIAWSGYHLYLSYFNKWPYWLTAEIKYQGIWYETWRKNMLLGDSISILLGIVAILSCIGLWNLKDWGRYLWLFISLIIGLFDIHAGLMNRYMFRNSALLEFGIADWIIYSIPFAVSLFSWVYLTKKNIVSFFIRAT